MASIDIDRIMDNVRLRLPGALDGAIQLEMFNVFDELLSGSHVWREEIEIDTRPGVLQYDLVPETPAYVVYLMSLTDADGHPVKGWMDEPPTLRLERDPGTETNYTALVSLTVSEPLTKEYFPCIPEWIIARYLGGIIDGILAKMMSQPAKPYSSERLAVYHLRRFERTIAAARVEAMRRNVYNSQTWRFPQSFATNRRR